MSFLFCNNESSVNIRTNDNDSNLQSNQYLQTNKLSFKMVEFSKKSKFICLFCGGLSCKLENYQKNHYKNAIQGLHSNWITDEILAMCRPSSQAIIDHQIIKQFKDNGINAIFNLQEPGEHPYCGQIIPETGFTYNPEDFQKNGIYFYNYFWEDMTVKVTFEKMVQIADTMDCMIKMYHKLSVHCHAGKGRTGMAVCAYLIYAKQYKAKDAIELFQSKRYNSLHKTSQKNYLIQFEEYVRLNRMSFRQSKYTIVELIDSQNKILNSDIKKQSKYIPILVIKCFEMLSNQQDQNLKTSIKILEQFTTPNINIQDLNDLIQHLNQFDFDYLNKCDIIPHGILLFFSYIKGPIIHSDSVKLINLSIMLSNQNMVEAFKNQLIKNVEYHEFFIVQKIVLFIQKLTNYDEILLEKFILQISISLLNNQSNGVTSQLQEIIKIWTLQGSNQDLITQAFKSQKKYILMDPFKNLK